MNTRASRTNKIAAFDDFNAHLPREIGVLEIRAVVGARREQHHRRVGHAGGRDVLQHLQQFLRIVLHRAARRCSRTSPGNARFIARRFSST